MELSVWLCFLNLCRHFFGHPRKGHLTKERRQSCVVYPFGRYVYTGPSLSGSLEPQPFGASCVGRYVDTGPSLSGSLEPQPFGASYVGRYVYTCPSLSGSLEPQPFGTSCVRSLSVYVCEYEWRGKISPHVQWVSCNNVWLKYRRFTYCHVCLSQRQW